MKDKPVYPIIQGITTFEGGQRLETETYGITLREHYAGLAMQARVINYGHPEMNRAMRDGWVKEYGEGINVETCFAKDAVIMADALIKELEK